MSELEPKDLIIEVIATNSSGWFPLMNGVRITHIPSRIFAESTEERSMHRNRNTAIARLTEKLESWDGVVQNVNADRVDAERYRWIRDSGKADDLIRSDCRGLYLPEKHALDAAVDAARKEQR